LKSKGRAAFYLCWFYAVFATIIALLEIHLIPENDRALFLIVKLTLGWMCVPAGFVLLRRPAAFWPTAVVGLSMMIYPAFCGYWRINYEQAVFELLIAYALGFRPSRRLFIAVSAGCVTLFSIVRVLRFDYLKSQFTNPAPQDGPFVAVATGGVVLIFYVFINYERRWREAALTRFGLIGQQASNIIHDVKNLIAAPSVHAATLKRKLEGFDDREVQEILEEMQTSLSRTSRLIFDLNEMARLAEDGIVSALSMRQLTHEVTDLLQNQLRGIALDIRGDLELRADRALLYSVMMSLFMNAADQLRKSKVEQPVIVIEFENGLCRISDNGGGFDSSVLRDLVNDGRAATTKSHGSGMGLFLVTNALAELGGRASFKNSGQGAVVELKFET
jgi:signal transduction histidine kinase